MIPTCHFFWTWKVFSYADMKMNVLFNISFYFNSVEVSLFLIDWCYILGFRVSRSRSSPSREQRFLPRHKGEKIRNKRQRKLPFKYGSFSFWNPGGCIKNWDEKKIRIHRMCVWQVGRKGNFKSNEPNSVRTTNTKSNL